MMMLHGGVRSQLEAMDEEMRRMRELTGRVAELKTAAGAAAGTLHDAARRLRDDAALRSVVDAASLQADAQQGPRGLSRVAGTGEDALARLRESLASRASQLADLHAAQWTQCATRVDGAVKAVATALAQLNPVAEPAAFEQLLAHAQQTSRKLEQALAACQRQANALGAKAPAQPPAATQAAVHVATFDKSARAAGRLNSALGPGGTVAKAVQALAAYVRFLDEVGMQVARAGSRASAPDPWEQQAQQALSGLRACADVALAASLLAGVTRSTSAAFTSAADKAEQAVHAFCRAYDMPDVGAAHNAVGWCRLATARARMDSADAAPASVHASLAEAHAWASEAVRGRAFPVALASLHGRDAAAAHVARAEKIADWYCRASASGHLSEAGVAELYETYRALVRMQ